MYIRIYTYIFYLSLSILPEGTSDDILKGTHNCSSVYFVELSNELDDV